MSLTQRPHFFNGSAVNNNMAIYDGRMNQTGGRSSKEIYTGRENNIIMK